MRNFPITMFFLLWSACLFLDCLSWGCRCYQAYPRVVHDPFFVGNLQLQHVFFTFVFSCFRVCTTFVERPKASKFLNIRRKASASLSSQRRPQRLLLLKREIRTSSNWKMWNKYKQAKYHSSVSFHFDLERSCKYTNTKKTIGSIGCSTMSLACILRRFNQLHKNQSQEYNGNFTFNFYESPLKMESIHLVKGAEATRLLNTISMVWCRHVLDFPKKCLTFKRS